MSPFALAGAKTEERLINTKRYSRPIAVNCREPDARWENTEVLGAADRTLRRPEHLH
jgi:hypothetical protein